MPLLHYDYLDLVNCPEVVIISHILCIAKDSNHNSSTFQIQLLERLMRGDGAGGAVAAHSAGHLLQLGGGRRHVLLWRAREG